jgi:hypothetical protein
LSFWCMFFRNQPQKCKNFNFSENYGDPNTISPKATQFLVSILIPKVRFSSLWLCEKITCVDSSETVQGNIFILQINCIGKDNVFFFYIKKKEKFYLGFTTKWSKLHCQFLFPFVKKKKS